MMATSFPAFQRHMQIRARLETKLPSSLCPLIATREPSMSTGVQCPSMPYLSVPEIRKASCQRSTESPEFRHSCSWMARETSRRTTFGATTTSTYELNWESPEKKLLLAMYSLPSTVLLRLLVGRGVMQLHMHSTQHQSDVWQQ